MMIPKNINGKKVGILGLGISGMSAAKSILAGGGKIFAYDDNNLNNKIDFIDPKNWPWDILDQILVSPGVPLSHPVIKKARSLKIKIINEIDIFAQSLPKAKVIGVTGTNGKSSTSSLIGHIIDYNDINVEVGGNIGKAATSLNDPGSKGFIVLELSSFQLVTCSQLKLDGGIILNITPDHLDWHGNIKNYVNAKIRIASFLKAKAPLLMSSNDNLSKIASEDLQKKNKNIIKIYNKKIKYNLPKNISYRENVNFAIKLLSALGMSEEKSLTAINSFKGLPHRMELIAKKNKIIFINDSKATNAEATSKALESFKNIFWIAGGKSKHNGIKSSLKYLKNVKKCYLIGESSSEFFDQLRFKLECNISGTIDRALLQIFEDTIDYKEEVTVLLSPAASSYDQFLNFEKRGETFKELVVKIWSL